MCSSCTNVHSSHAVCLHWPLNDAHPMREDAIIRVVPAVNLVCDCVCVCICVCACARDERGDNMRDKNEDADRFEIRNPLC